jgi:hypothetical protein
MGPTASQERVQASKDSQEHVSTRVKTHQSPLETLSSLRAARFAARILRSRHLRRSTPPAFLVSAPLDSHGTVSRCRQGDSCMGHTLRRPRRNGS